jgi:hypothetical protein
MSKYIFLMRVLYSHKQANSLKLCTCYILRKMFQSFRVELIPRATGNGYQNMQITVFEKECLIVVCPESMQSGNYLLTSKK